MATVLYTINPTPMSTMPQAGRSRVRVPMRSLDVLINLILPAHYGPGVNSASNRNEYQVSYGGQRAAGE
jgi:hypothetical protein